MNELLRSPKKYFLGKSGTCVIKRRILLQDNGAGFKTVARSGKYETATFCLEVNLKITFADYSVSGHRPSETLESSN